MGSKPSDEGSCAISGIKCVGDCCFGWSVLGRVYSDDDACEGGDGEGRVEAAAAGVSSACGWDDGSIGEREFSSGLAMRSPPRDCERLRSPFIVSRKLGYQVTNEGGGGGCGANDQGAARRVKHAMMGVVQKEQWAASWWEGPEARNRRGMSSRSRMETGRGRTAGEAVGCDARDLMLGNVES